VKRIKIKRTILMRFIMLKLVEYVRVF